MCVTANILIGHHIFTTTKHLTLTQLTYKEFLILRAEFKCVIMKPRRVSVAERNMSSQLPHRHKFLQ